MFITFTLKVTLVLALALALALFHTLIEFVFVKVSAPSLQTDPLSCKHTDNEEVRLLF